MSSVITQDDVAAFEGVLAAIDQAAADVDDLADRCQRKGDWTRFHELEGASLTLSAARRKVQEQLR